MIKVLFVCHGNICRSTMAQSVLVHMVTQRGLQANFYINSAATSREEIGNPPHRGTAAKLRQEGVPVVPHAAVQLTKADYDRYDYLIGMDDANIRDMKRISGGDPEGKIYKMLDFADCTDYGDSANPADSDDSVSFVGAAGCEAGEGGGRIAGGKYGEGESRRAVGQVGSEAAAGRTKKAAGVKIQSGRDVADPWYTGDFDATYRDVVRGCEGFLRKIATRK